MMNAAEKEIYEYAVKLLKSGEGTFRIAYPYTMKHTERCIEVPWVAANLNKYKIKSLLDVGFTFASHDYLRLILDFACKNELSGIDIINPEKVKSRYPKEWWPEIAQIPVYIGDISTCVVRERKNYDAVSLISTMEHIGFDEVSVTMPESAFERAKTQDNAKRKRLESIEDKVLDNISTLLKNGGYCFISVPAGRGGPILLRDSMGLYTCEWEYEKDSWRKITGHNRFECVEEQFYGLNEKEEWQPYESISELENSTAVMKEFAVGLACCVLRKK